MKGERRTSFALMLLLAAPLLAQEPSFRTSSSDLVVLPVVVTDKQQRPVSDLPTERFVVYDNGRRVPIALFTNEDTPVTVGLVIDASGSMGAKLGEVIAASMAFARTSNPRDELFALRFNDDVLRLVPERPFLMASDLGALESAVTSIQADGRTALYDGLMAGLDHLAEGTRSRKVLIVISDGGDNISEATLDTVLARARESDAAIYTIGIYDDTDLDRNPGALKALARASGGERYLPRSPGDLLSVCEHIAREIRGGYTIGYVPPDRDGAFHRIKVEIAAARGLTVRTRAGYLAARPAQP
jgi:Ca-activated chloride channel family protein